VRRFLCLLAVLVIPQPIFATNTFFAGARVGDTTFYWGDSANFAASMVFKYQVDLPGTYFSVNTLGQTWNIYAELGIKGWEALDTPEGLTVRDMTISLEDSTGELIFDQLVSLNTVWPGGEDGISFSTPITGQGTFTAISFTLGFESVPPSTVGAIVYPLWGSSYLSSAFGINGYDGLGDPGYMTVIPEPSALSLLAVGLGGLAMMRRRRS
jgi:hypothetical protein